MAEMNNNYFRGDAFAHLKGRLFGSWVTAGARSNGYATTDYIDNPAYAIESIIRDEVHVERDLTITGGVVGITDIISTNLINESDDFYNGAYYHNVDTDQSRLISDYTGSTKELILASGDGSAAVGNHFYLTNIQCDISIATFDAIGNTTNGTRKDWVFAKSINAKVNARDILEQLCFESHCMLFKSYKSYKLIALDTGASIATFATPLKETGNPKMAVRLTPLESVFTDFTLFYGYDYGKGDYSKKAFCNRYGSSDATNLGATYKTKCENAEKNYLQKSKWEYSADWIYDDNTAAYFLQKIIRDFTIQRLQVQYFGNIESHIQYELGDLVKINYNYMIPTGKNNSAIFMINGKTIIPDAHNPAVKFNLIEMV